ncbi:MAG: C40 family peptidase [Nocardioidaceae bacterium]
MPATSRRLRLTALPLLLAILSATVVLTVGSAGASTADLSTASARTTSVINTGDSTLQRRARRIRNAVQVARNQIGDPYVYGAAGPGAFDCSGLTMYAYAKAGVRLPRSSDAQAGAVRRVKRSNLHSGDLMFFTSGGSVYHVGIFLKRRGGRPIILHSSYSGRSVQRDPVWTNNWFAGTLRPR